MRFAALASIIARPLSPGHYYRPAIINRGLSLLEPEGVGMEGPENLRVYGILLRGRRVLVAAERVAGLDVLKFPGGAVEAQETPEQALVREFREECALLITPLRLLHAPGTLLSPWTHADYTPLYYEVGSKGEPRVPPEEAMAMRFMAPEEVIGSGRMADPEILALKRVCGR